MTTNRPEFKAHDDFIFEHKKVGKVTREEFIKYIRSSHDHMLKLSEIIQQYNQTIDGYLDEWDGKFESFDEDVKDLLHLWIQDGTMDHIINENLMSSKADKTYVDELHDTTTAQLAQKAQQTALEVEKERINNLIALPEGSTTNDARLEDIAIGYDGTVYNSPGEAVRTQLEEITKGSWNLTNEVVNGDFSTPDISHITSTLDLEVADGRLKASKSNWTYSSGAMIVIQNGYDSWDEGDIYYVKGALKVIGDTQYPFRFGGFNGGIVVNANNYRELNVVSGVFSPADKNFVIRHFLNNSEYVEITLDNIVTINLTKTFGAGNEPTKEEMDNLMELSGGWFGGVANEKMVSLWLLENAIDDKSDTITDTVTNKKYKYWISLNDGRMVLNTEEVI